MEKWVCMKEGRKGALDARPHGSADSLECVAQLVAAGPTDATMGHVKGSDDAALGASEGEALPSSGASLSQLLHDWTAGCSCAGTPAQRSVLGLQY